MKLLAFVLLFAGVGFAQIPTGVQQVSGTAPIVVSPTTGNPVVSCPTCGTGPTVSFQTNSVANISQAILNIANSTVNAAGLSNTCSNTASGTVVCEVGVSSASTARTALGLTAPTGCPSGTYQYPCEIPSAKIDLSPTNTNAATVRTTWYAVPVGAGGTYRANCYFVLTQAATSSSTLPYCYVIYYDEDTGIQATTQIGATNTLNTVGTTTNVGWAVLSYGTIIIHVQAGTTIQYQPTNGASSGATTAQFAGHLTLEYVSP